MENRKWVLSLLALAGLSTTAVAGWQPQVGFRVRAGKPGQLTLQLRNLRAATVEVEVDGAVIVTRAVGQAGTVMLNLQSAGLAPGVHNALLKLYDAQGRLIGQQQVAIELLPDPNSPLTIVVPRNGVQVMGTVPVEARVNRRESVYVSFFVDGQIRGLRNYPPYVYNWDTTRETNGWHTLEVWSYDGNQTLKTPPMRVFVNNPGGRTERAVSSESESVEPATQVAASELATVESAQPVLATPEVRPSEETRLSLPESPAEPPVAPSVAPALAEPAFTATTNGAAPVQPSPNRLSAPQDEPNLIPSATTPSQSVREPRSVSAEPQMRGQKLRAPQVALAPTAPATKNAAPRTEGVLVQLEYGVRLPAGVSQFDVVVDAAPIAFDVAPVVEEGVALIPVRHVLEQVGAQLRWDNQTKTATLRLGGRTATLRVRANEVQIDGRTLPLDAPLRIVRGRVLIPASALREILNAEILYDGANGQAAVNTDRE